MRNDGVDNRNSYSYDNPLYGRRTKASIILENDNIGETYYENETIGIDDIKNSDNENSDTEV